MNRMGVTAGRFQSSQLDLVEVSLGGKLRFFPETTRERKLTEGFLPRVKLASRMVKNGRVRRLEVSKWHLSVGSFTAFLDCYYLT